MANEPLWTFLFRYSREDAEFALRLAKDLRAFGAVIWLDQLDISPGERWDRAVENAVANCPRMLVILSPCSVPLFSNQFRDSGLGATIIAQQSAETHMVEVKLPADGRPTDTFLDDRRRKYHNGNDIQIFHEPHALTDGDSIVQFRQADVLVAGDVFNTTQFPFIDIKDGGSFQGEINARNDILNRTVFEHEGQCGTPVVPGQGYLSDEHEVVENQDMLVIVRDRIRAMLKNAATLDRVKAARVTADYDTRYSSNTGAWTTDMFVEAVYTSLKQTEK